MAKPRRGLGRGLNSLLGGMSDDTFSKEAHTSEKKPERTFERITVNEDSSDRQDIHPESEKWEPAEQSSQVPDQSDAPVPSSEPVYSDAVDNITIKSVKERVAAPTGEVPTMVKVSAQVEEQSEGYREVPINDVFPNPDQPRTNFKPEELAELADSIKKDGLLQPILVRKIENGKYQIIAGERRWQACKKLGLAEVPIRIKDADENRAIELALVENVQRSDLNPIEEAYGYRRMMERGNLTQSEIAKTVSKGRSTIANALRLLELPEDAQQLLFEEKITAGHARAILSIPTEEGRKKLTVKLVKDKLSVREAESIARLLSGRKSENATPRAPLPQSYKKVARALRETLNRGVRIKSSKGKNKIEIEFSDEDDLKKLFEEISSRMEEKVAE